MPQDPEIRVGSLVHVVMKVDEVLRGLSLRSPVTAIIVNPAKEV